jgi:hypothetical protein
MKTETVEEFLARGGKVKQCSPAITDEKYAVHDSRLSNNRHLAVSYRIVRSCRAAFTKDTP